MSDTVGQALVLHVYGQLTYHDHVTVVGTRDSLARLRTALDRALADGAAEEEMMVADGEAYSLRVIVHDEDWEAENWQSLHLPYSYDPIDPDRRLSPSGLLDRARARDRISASKRIAGP